MPSYGFVAYDQIESGLNENGPYLASLVGIDRIENWTGLDREQKRARKERWMDRIIADLDSQYPEIAAAIVHREMSNAETFQHYLDTPGGALYGFAPETRGFCQSRRLRSTDCILLPLSRVAAASPVRSGWRLGGTRSDEGQGAAQLRARAPGA